MHDEFIVRLGHGEQCVEEQPNPRSHIEPVLVTKAVNVVAFNVFEYKKRLAGWRHTCVNQFRDVRMSQATKNAAFAFEPLFAAFAHQRDIEHLYCYAPLESPVV